MDPDVAEALLALGMSAHQERDTAYNMVRAHLAQVTAGIGANLLQQHGGPSAVPGLLASAQAASRSPWQGML